MPIARSALLDKSVRVPQPGLVNAFGCTVGPHLMIGPVAEIQAGVAIGERCKIQSHVFVSEGVAIEDEVFVGHGVVFTNDRLPRSTNPDGSRKGVDDWTLEETIVRRRASIGPGAVVLCGLEIGEGAMVGAGAVVTKSVPVHAIVVGKPARVVGDVRELESLER